MLHSRSVNPQCLRCQARAASLSHWQMPVLPILELEARGVFKLSATGGPPPARAPLLAPDPAAGST